MGSHALHRHPDRRSAITNGEKMLTQHLREMEEDGLVHREVYAQVPPRVEYSLTEHGRTLNQALGPLGAWGGERVRRQGFEVVDVVETSHGQASRPPTPRVRAIPEG